MYTHRSLFDENANPFSSSKCKPLGELTFLLCLFFFLLYLPFDCHSIHLLCHFLTIRPKESTESINAKIKCVFSAIITVQWHLKRALLIVSTWETDAGYLIWLLLFQCSSVSKMSTCNAIQISCDFYNKTKQ